MFTGDDCDDDNPYVYPVLLQMKMISPAVMLMWMAMDTEILDMVTNMEIQ